MTKHGIFGTFGAGAASALLTSTTPLTGQAVEMRQPENKPNIILMLIDDMGYGDLACFGSKINRTPNLDKLAAEGVKFTSFYAAPVCSASRAQLLTGCYNKRVDVPAVLFPVASAGLSPDEKTIASLLKPKGYSTMAIGKWHLGDQSAFLPTNHGFDHWFGIPYSNDMGPKETKNEKKKKKKEDNRPPLPLVNDKIVIEAPVDCQSVTKRYTEVAVKFITDNKDKPFFLYFPHTAVHTPLSPGKDFVGKSGHGPYCDWVAEVDWSMGEIVDTLKKLRLDKNTLVIFLSDNGSNGKNGASNAPFRGAKFSTWEGGMRVPFIARWPGMIPAGTSCDTMTSEIDIMPTLVKLAGGEIPKDRIIDGMDIWSLLCGKSKESPHEAIYYWFWTELQAVRSGPWKMAIATQKGGGSDDDENDGKKNGKEGDTPASREKPRLYNLDADPGENNDIATENPEVVKRLQSLVDKMEKDLGSGKTGKKETASGIRTNKHKVGAPKPMLMLNKDEYD